MLQLYYDWSNTDYIPWIVFCFWRSFLKWRRYLDLDSFPEWHNEEVWFRTSLPLLEDFVELLHPQKLLAGTPKMMVLKMSLLSFRDDFSGSNVRLWLAVCTSRPRKDYFLLPWPKTGSIEIYHCTLQTSSVLKNQQHPKPKNSTELVSTTKTQRQEKPFPFLIELTWWQDLQNSYGHTAASYAASNKYKAPWWCPCTPCKTNMEPQKLVVSPWNQGFPIVACEQAVSCQGW